VRQLIHELRTPLGAITGFAEIIEQQLFGPVSLEYRALAANISRDAHFLLAGFDDLDTALKLDRGMLDDHDGLTDAQWLGARMQDRLQALVNARQCHLELCLDTADAPLALSHQSADRIFLRLGGALISIAAQDETLRIISEQEGQGSLFWFDKPRALSGINDEDLFDTEFGLPESLQSAPLLGLGFTLRLVRSLVAKHKGEMILKDTRIGISLPRFVDQPEALLAKEGD
jgi:two-component system OmpR family sensor kinase